MRDLKPLGSVTVSNYIPFILHPFLTSSSSLPLFPPLYTSIGLVELVVAVQAVLFNYLFLFYLRRGSTQGERFVLFQEKLHIFYFMFKIKDLLLVFITGDFLSQITPWEAY